MRNTCGELRRFYDERLPGLRKAERKLQELLRKVAASIEDKSLVRAEVRSVRIKHFESFRAKVQRKQWSTAEASSVCGDLVGGRVVCNNLEDVRRYAELLKENSGDARPLVDEQDYMDEPGIWGYRGLHLTLRLNVGDHLFRPDVIPCEVQIRTRLQDAWAGLVHDDIYKQSGLPEDLGARAADLAEVLAAADRIASGIRTRAMLENTPPAQPPRLDRVSVAGLAYLFGQHFGRSPMDYALRQALDVCKQLGVDSLEGLPRYLDNAGNAGFPEDVRLAYAGIVGVPVANELVFLVALRAVASGENEAIDWIKREAYRETEEFEQISRNHVLAELPETVEEFIEFSRFSWDGMYIELLADIWGTAGRCSICDTAVIHADEFAEAATRHYKVGDREEVEVFESILRNLQSSAVETGGWNDATLCAYCHWTIQRDD